MAKNILLAVLVVVIAFVAWQSYLFVRTTNTIKGMRVENIDFEDVKDGSYEGAVNAVLVSARVRVDVKDGAVTGIEILEHNHGPKYSGGPMVQRILDAQSLEVDAISGATGSSVAICKAVEKALIKGRGRKAALAAQADAGTTEETEAEAAGGN
ncbi:MAG: FMN-binding protein [Chitinivibrionales bacterium]|nr:FMN-binding protein [Chitinivibrionales bacterium]MBD3394631.1 FMN-binding protein [Chitinivibrionales bacterium]